MNRNEYNRMVDGIQPPDALKKRIFLAAQQHDVVPSSRFTHLVPVIAALLLVVNVAVFWNTFHGEKVREPYANGFIDGEEVVIPYSEDQKLDSLKAELSAELGAFDYERRVFSAASSTMYEEQYPLCGQFSSGSRYGYGYVNPTASLTGSMCRYTKMVTDPAGRRLATNQEYVVWYSSLMPDDNCIIAIRATYAKFTATDLQTLPEIPEDAVDAAKDAVESPEHVDRVYYKRVERQTDESELLPLVCVTYRGNEASQGFVQCPAGEECDETTMVLTYHDTNGAWADEQLSDLMTPVGESTFQPYWADPVGVTFLPEGKGLPAQQVVDILHAMGYDNVQTLGVAVPDSEEDPDGAEELAPGTTLSCKKVFEMGDQQTGLTGVLRVTYYQPEGSDVVVQGDLVCLTDVVYNTLPRACKSMEAAGVNYNFRFATEEDVNVYVRSNTEGTICAVLYEKDGEKKLYTAPKLWFPTGGTVTLLVADGCQDELAAEFAKDAPDTPTDGREPGINGAAFQNQLKGMTYEQALKTVWRRFAAVNQLEESASILDFIQTTYDLTQPEDAVLGADVRLSREKGLEVRVIINHDAAHCTKPNCALDIVEGETYYATMPDLAKGQDTPENLMRMEMLRCRVQYMYAPDRQLGDFLYASREAGEQVPLGEEVVLYYCNENDKTRSMQDFWDMTYDDYLELQQMLQNGGDMPAAFANVETIDVYPSDSEEQSYYRDPNAPTLAYDPSLPEGRAVDVIFNQNFYTSPSREGYDTTYSVMVFVNHNADDCEIPDCYFCQNPHCGINLWNRKLSDAMNQKYND